MRRWERARFSQSTVGNAKADANRAMSDILRSLAGKYHRMPHSVNC